MIHKAITLKLLELNYPVTFSISIKQIKTPDSAIKSDYVRMPKIGQSVIMG